MPTPYVPASTCLRLIAFTDLYPYTLCPSSPIYNRLYPPDPTGVSIHLIHFLRQGSGATGEGVGVGVGVRG